MPELVRRRMLVVGLGALAGLAAHAGAPDPKPVVPDSDFLEYLGSGDDLDPEFQKYLAQPDGAEKQDAKPAPKRGSGTT